MRIIGEIPHPECKISLFAWNNRYIIKIEWGPLEQTFKVDQFDLINEQQLSELVSEPFIADALQRFNQMHQSLQQSLQSL